MLPRLLIILISAIAGILTWLFLPGTTLDRAAFHLTARSFANPPFFITGQGSHSEPYTLQTLRAPSTEDPEQNLTIVSITDDPDRIFQTSPPSPVDFAVILNNLKRLGKDRLCIGLPLAWDEPDTIPLIALDQQLDSFSGVVTAAPLTRGSAPAPLPPAFRRASIPISEVQGDISRLPIINRVSIPDIILGNKTSFAGFSALESETPSEHPSLLARWSGEDRVVLSFHLLSALNILNLPPEKIHIQLGEYIALSKKGPYIPIDEFGRLSFSISTVPPASTLTAQSLIDAPESIFSENPSPSAILRDDQSASDPATLAFSKPLTNTIAALVDPSHTTESRTFTRLPTAIEISLLALLLCLTFAMGYHHAVSGKIALLFIAAAIAAFHFVITPSADIWLPTIPFLVTLTLPAFLLILSPTPKSQPTGTTASKPPSSKPPAKKPPTKKTAKKTTRKPAKKATRKKAPRRKRTRKAAKKTSRKKPSS
ncbi:MAG: hypothetical protein ACSHX7_12275 [Luteolibacter sp.]